MIKLLRGGACEGQNDICGSSKCVFPPKRPTVCVPGRRLHCVRFDGMIPPSPYPYFTLTYGKGKRGVPKYEDFDVRGLAWGKCVVCLGVRTSLLGRRNRGLR